MNWITLTAWLVGWLLAGLGVAYLFGHLARRGETLGSGELAPPVLSYMRRMKRAKPAWRAALQGKTRRAANGGRR